MGLKKIKTSLNIQLLFEMIAQTSVFRDDCNLRFGLKTVLSSPIEFSQPTEVDIKCGE